MRAIVISPHGDDFTIFAGGLIALYCREGHEVTIVRVTNDEKDCFSGDVAATVEANRAEAEEAAALLGVRDVVHLGYRDCELDPLDETEMRGRLVGLFRERRPDLVIGFDPWAPFEENPDHLKCARVMDDACWAANYPHFYAQQLRSGLRTHAIGRRAYFARSLERVNRYVDISDVLAVKVRAMQAHRTMSAAILRNLRDVSRAAGLSVPFLERDVDLARFSEEFILARAAHAGRSGGLDYAEAFRFAEFDETNAVVAHLLTLDA